MAEPEIRDKLIEFAEKNPKIYAIYRGSSDPDGTQVEMYYFLHDTSFDWSLSDHMGELELEMYKQQGRSVHTMQWPVNPEEIRDYPFLEEPI